MDIDTIHHSKSADWILQPFQSLEVQTLYSALRLRSEVFVVEQQCVFLDMDDKDQQSWHLMGSVDEKIVAYCRLLPPGLAYAEASIGRVVSSPAARREGFGRQLMGRAIDACRSLFGEGDIVIGAQCYLESFYGSFGFEQEEEVYMEDGIPHIKMRLTFHR